MRRILKLQEYIMKFKHSNQMIMLSMKFISLDAA